MRPPFLQAAADCLKVIANPHRIGILLLLRDGTLTVGEIARRCALQSHVTSEHLRLMQRCGFLSSVREGRFIRYQIQELHLLELLACMERKFSEKPYENNKHITVKKSARARKAALPR